MIRYRLPLVRLAFVITGIAQMSLGAQQTASLRLTIETERPTVALGEPVYLTARIRNEGRSAARLIPLLKPADGLLVVSISGPRGERAGYVPLNVRDSDIGPADLAAGGQLAVSFPVFFGAAGWTMRTPGAYTLRARFTIHDGSGRPRDITSEQIVVRVGEQQAALMSTLLNGSAPSLQAGKFLLWSGGDHLAEGQSLLAGLASQAREAPVVDHYRLASGRSLARPFKDYAKGAVRPADHGRAVTELEQTRDSVLPSYLQVQKYLGLAVSYRALGRAADADRAATRVRSLIGERPELAEFREQLDRLGPAPPSSPRRPNE